MPVTDAARAQQGLTAGIPLADHAADHLDAQRASARLRRKGDPIDRYAAGVCGFIVGIIVSAAYGATRG